MEDFASYVGLSRPTVSKYFNNPGSVRSKTRARIERAVEQSGFRPNLFATNLKRRRTRVLGVIIPNTTDPFYMELTRRIEDIAQDAGYFPFVLSSNGDSDLETEAIGRLQSLSVAGAIVVPLGATRSNADLARLEARIPLVYVDSSPDHDMPFVGTDNVQTFHLIVDYLCRSGTAPAYLGMPDINRNAGARRDAYAAAMSAFREPARFIDIPPETTWEFERVGHESMTAALSRPAFPRTVLCANDRIAFGALLAAWEAGLKVGHGDDADIRIAGHDDHPLSRYSCPPLTTVAQNYGEIARVAMQKLIRRLEGREETGERHMLLRGDLILRRSA
ncbi:Transcriptional regulator [Celeribacter indicus]|uniref:Transcriptional regulator n=2 Tax=Celeribacter indicus TaxID=1208324 RepID=A0A0B5DUM8_9RHOB|nr:Transcriptional regulator [Celeribacter indicus]